VVDSEAIRGAIAGVIRYPRIARRQGIEGRVVVRFRVVDGRAEGLQVVESAGAILDEAALQAVMRAGPFKGEGWVRVPVDFLLHAQR
jgi:TonB family protein